MSLYHYHSKSNPATSYVGKPVPTSHRMEVSRRVCKWGQPGVALLGSYKLAENSVYSKQFAQLFSGMSQTIKVKTLHCFVLFCFFPLMKNLLF